MSKWKPIDTAPKDGTKIMIGYVGGYVGCAAYHTAGPSGVGWYRDGGAIGSAPTHWMPLPTAPE